MRSSIVGLALCILLAGCGRPVERAYKEQNTLADAAAAATDAATRPADSVPAGAPMLAYS